MEGKKAPFTHRPKGSYVNLGEISVCMKLHVNLGEILHYFLIQTMVFGYTYSHISLHAINA